MTKSIEEYAKEFRKLIESFQEYGKQCEAKGRNDACDYIQDNWGWDGTEETFEEKQLKEVMQRARSPLSVKEK